MERQQLTSKEDVWAFLYEEQSNNFMENDIKISNKWITGMIHLAKSGQLLPYYPALEDISIPHWRVFPVLGKQPEPEFWYRLSRGVFNVNMRLRDVEHLRYLEERDLFHDTFGHLPILLDKQYTDYLLGLGTFAQYATPEGLKALSNIYWFTSEFGLVLESGVPHAYGAGIISSIDESQYALSTDANVHMWDINQVIAVEDYVTDGFQKDYFILQGWSVLSDILRYLWKNYVP